MSEITRLQAEAAYSRLVNLQDHSAPFRRDFSGMIDAFQDQSGITSSLSTNLAYDVLRTAFTPTRSLGKTVDSDTFNNLAGWTDTSTGSGVGEIVASNSSDPAIGPLGVQLRTGSTTGSIASIERNVGSVPAQFGILIISTLSNVGTAGVDALEGSLENSAGKMLKWRQRDEAFEIWVDSAWQMIITHGGDFATEWWIDALDVGGGDHAITIHAGSEFIATYTGVLDAGTVDGRLIFKQHSGSANNRYSRIWIEEVGIRQSSDNLALLSEMKTTAASPTTGKIYVLFEDVSNVVNINNNFTVSISKDDGATLELVTLTNDGIAGIGEIDPYKKMFLFSGEVTFAPGAGREMRYKINVTGNQFIAIHGVDLKWGDDE